MLIEHRTKEITLKLVYYGPALSGKTTNLKSLHWLSAAQSRGDMMSLETQNDRTLFFDMLPLTLRSEGGVQVRVKLFTVPGQVMHDATRRMVLRGTDGIAFIADSQLSETDANHQSFINMQDNLKANNIDPEATPLVIQFNKRDLPNIRSEEEIKKIAAKSQYPVFLAVASNGYGVMQTFRGLVERTWKALDTRHNLGEKFGLDSREFLNSLDKQLRQVNTNNAR